MSNTDAETKPKKTQQIKKDIHDVVIMVVADLISGLISYVITKIFKTYDKIDNWLKWQNWDFNPVIAIAVSIVLGAVAVFLWRKSGVKGKIEKILSSILFFCGVALLVNSIYIAPRPQQKFIAYREINRESLSEQHTVDIPIPKPYLGLTLEIERAGNGPAMYPEMELAKINPQRGDWPVEKLNIPGLETAKPDELYYRLKNGAFRVREADGTDVGLDEENTIRINVRNFAGFEDTIKLTFFGITKQGENK